MYARIVQIPLVSDAGTGASTYFQNTVGPALKQQTGFVNSRFLVDAVNNTCMMVTLWASEADRTAAETNGFLREVLQNMKPHFTGPPVIGYYEVTVQVV